MAKSRFCQHIDARSTVDCIEQRIAGVYNTVTPVGSYSIGQLQRDSVAVTGADMTPVWVDSAFLREHEAAESLPIWAPPDGDTAGVARVSGQRALAKGLVTRPPRETCRDTLSWWRTLPDERRQAPRAGLEAVREAELLAAWRTRGA